MARYNLQLIGDGKDFTEEQVLAFIECHPDDFNPQQKKNDSTDESDSESSDSCKVSKYNSTRKNRQPPITCAPPPQKRSKKVQPNNTLQDPSHQLQSINSHYSYTNSSYTTSSAKYMPNNCAGNNRSIRVEREEEDIFMYFETHLEPFGFVRINIFLTIQELRETILDEEVAELDERDLFLYKTATIKSKQEHKILIKECIITDEAGQYSIIVRKHVPTVTHSLASLLQPGSHIYTHQW